VKSITVEVLKLQSPAMPLQKSTGRTLLFVPAHNEHDTGSVETDNNLQRPGKTKPNVNSYDSGEARLSISDSSGQTFAQ
jgi:hypothetical protein